MGPLRLLLMASEKLNDLNMFIFLQYIIIFTSCFSEPEPVEDEIFWVKPEPIPGIF